MLLAIDVGNTETVIGLYDGAELLDHWRIRTDAERTSDEHALLVRQFLDIHNLHLPDDITGVAVASAVPRLTAALRDMTERYANFPALVIETGVKTGMPILYENPREVAPDRIADAVAAYDLYGGPTIVVDFGTATIVEAVSAKGEYLGGAIFPGIEISLDALFQHAAGLRRAELVEPKNVIGRTVIESVQSGVLYGFAGQVDALVGRFEAELGECTVVATGAQAPLIAPYSESIEHLEPWLTLHGLRIIYNRNQDAT